MSRLPINLLIAEVESGLPNETTRIKDAMRANSFYTFQGKTEMAQFLKDAETPFDYVSRPYRESGFVHEAVDVLTEHLYSPGPNRTWSEPAGQEFLERVGEDNHLDALMLRADQMSTLHDIAAIQVDADEGIWEDKPITLRLWDASEFHVWTDPDNRTRPDAVVTMDRFDLTTRYRLWTDDEVLTFESKKAEGTSGGRRAWLTAREPNTYQCLPFAFVHYRLPVQTFWDPGIGDLLVDGEVRLNDRLSRLDESINKHLNPVPVAENVEDNWQPILEANRFIRLNHAKGRIGATGGYEDGPEPRLYYLQATIDVASAWDDLMKYLNQLLEAARVPASAVRMQQEGVMSGIALIVEQAPLLTRARKRRGAFSVYETNLARTILRCAGNHYGRRDLVTAAQKGRLTLGWPQPSVPIPTQDRLDLAIGEVTAGLKSLIMVAQEWYGVGRDQAIEILKQVKEDQDELALINPDLSMAGRPESEDEEGEGDDESPKSSANGNGQLVLSVSMADSDETTPGPPVV